LELIGQQPSAVNVKRFDDRTYCLVLVSLLELGIGVGTHLQRQHFLQQVLVRRICADLSNQFFVSYEAKQMLGGTKTSL